MNYNNIVFDLNLETVHEKAHDKFEAVEASSDTKNASIEISDKLKNSD